MEPTRQSLSRRGFLQVSAATVGAAALAGVLPRSLLAQSGADGLAVVSPNPTPDDQATVLVDDVLDFCLRGDFAWNGGWVRFRLHEGRLDGEPIWFIRTDASDQTFASDAGLVFLAAGCPGRGRARRTTGHDCAMRFTQRAQMPPPATRRPVCRSSAMNPTLGAI